MINAIKRMFGMHVHEWGPYGETYSQNFERNVPIIEQQLMIDEDGDEYFEDVETGDYEVQRWTETMQDRTCATCGLKQSIQTTAR
jgi:hypothetical protein